MPAFRRTNIARRHCRHLLAGAICALGVLASAAAAQAQNVRVSQIFAGAGEPGSAYTTDFVELYNAGTQPVNLSALSLAVASSPTDPQWHNRSLRPVLFARHNKLEVIKGFLDRQDTTILAVGDSRSAYRENRLMGAIYRTWPVRLKALWITASTSSIGQGDGGGMFTFGWENPPASRVAETVAPGSLMFNAQFTNRFPVPAVCLWSPIEPIAPWISRWCDIAQTAGGSMVADAQGTPGGYFAQPNPDPPAGTNPSVKVFLLSNNDPTKWLRESGTFGYLSSSSGAGATPGWSIPFGPYTDLSIWTLNIPAIVTPGQSRISARLFDSNLDDGQRTGRGRIILGARIEFNQPGIVLIPMCVGGEKTTSHLSSAGGNVDWRYGDVEAADFVRRCAATPNVIVRVELGQNQSIQQGFYEWDGSSINTYKENVRKVIQRWRSIAAAAGVPNVVFELVSPWAGAEEYPAYDLMSDALLQLSNEEPDCAFYDQHYSLKYDLHMYQGGGVGLNFQLAPDGVHQQFDGMLLLGRAEWAALAGTTLAPGHWALVGVGPVTNQGQNINADLHVDVPLNVLTSGAGKVALISGDLSPGACLAPGALGVLDCVSYSSSRAIEGCFAGLSGPAISTASAAMGISRRCAGRFDTGNTRADFVSMSRPPRTLSTLPFAEFSDNLGSIEPGTSRAGSVVRVLASPSPCEGNISSVAADCSRVGGPSMLPLRDDGAGSDTQANDGIYTGNFASGPTIRAGNYEIPVLASVATGEIIRSSARIQITRPGSCACDWNISGGVEVQDLLDYIGAWLAGCSDAGPGACRFGSADFNASGSVTVQDLLDFFSCWFNASPSCP